jgi:hypothetical protein
MLDWVKQWSAKILQVWLNMETSEGFLNTESNVEAFTVFIIMEVQKGNVVYDGVTILETDAYARMYFPPVEWGQYMDQFSLGTRYYEIGHDIYSKTARFLSNLIRERSVFWITRKKPVLRPIEEFKKDATKHVEVKKIHRPAKMIKLTD